jgi:predicted P-loop ATPase
MKEGDYKIIVTVYEAQELEPKNPKFLFFDMKKSAVDGFAEVEIMGQTRKTAVSKPLYRFERSPTILSGRNLSTSTSKISASKIWITPKYQSVSTTKTTFSSGTHTSVA